MSITLQGCFGPRQVLRQGSCYYYLHPLPVHCLCLNRGRGRVGFLRAGLPRQQRGRRPEFGPCDPDPTPLPIGPPPIASSVLVSDAGAWLPRDLALAPVRALSGR